MNIKGAAFSQIFIKSLLKGFAVFFLYKIGCYMFKITVKGEDGKDVVKYGIKNFNPNVNKNIVMNATMSAGSVLYAPSSSPSNVFVFDKVTVGSNVSYTVYRLV